MPNRLSFLPAAAMLFLGVHASAFGRSGFASSAATLTTDQQVEYGTHILRAQDLIDGLLSRIAPSLDAVASGASLVGNTPSTVAKSYVVDLAPSAGPGLPPGGVIPSPLAALLSTTGKIGVRSVGQIVLNTGAVNAGAKSANFDVTIWANTDIVLTDAADSKTLTVRKGTFFTYSFVWSLLTSGDKIYASFGHIDRFPVIVNRQGTVLNLDFATTFDVGPEQSGGTSSVKVAFDDYALFTAGVGARQEFDRRNADAHLFHVQFRIEDVNLTAGMGARLLKAAVYVVDGTAVDLAFAATDI